MMNSLAFMPAADVSCSKSCSVVHGLSAAVEALCRPTHLQQQHRAASDSQQMSNCGRIICLTTLKRSTFDVMCSFCIIKLQIVFEELHLMRVSLHIHITVADLEVFCLILNTEASRIIMLVM